MRVLDLFSGIGAFSLGLQRAGMTPIAFVEIDPFCRDVLARHWPGVPIHDDVRTAEFPAADVICGGFPCQDVSRAGKRAGVTGERSGLYRELVRAFRVVRPKVAIVENVAELLAAGMGDVLGDLAEGGNCVEWDCVPAKAIGAPHERDRVWIVAHTDSERQREARGLRHQQVSLSSGRIAPSCQQPSDPEGDGCGQGRQGRPPDSFARIRDATRGHASDPTGAGLEGREQPETARGSQSEPAGRHRNPWWPWTNEPEISGVDDGDADWVERTRATGNSLVPQIPELIGRAILEAERAPVRRARAAGAP